MFVARIRCHWIAIIFCRNFHCLFCQTYGIYFDPIYSVHTETWIFIHRHKPTHIYLSQSELCSLYWITHSRWHILGKSTGLKNDCIIYRFIYAWPCRPYVKEMTQICLYFEQAISNYLYNTNNVIEQMQTIQTQPHMMLHRQNWQAL